MLFRAKKWLVFSSYIKIFFLGLFFVPPFFPLPQTSHFYIISYKPFGFNRARSCALLQVGLALLTTKEQCQLTPSRSWPGAFKSHLIHGSDKERKMAALIPSPAERVLLFRFLFCCLLHLPTVDRGGIPVFSCTLKIERF